MKAIVGIVSFLLFSAFSFHGQDTIFIHYNKLKIEIEQLEFNTDSLLFINLHSNETTSIEAIKKVLPLKGGKYLGILSGTRREVRLIEGNNSIIFDPNRIFTKNGIEKTLKNYNCLSQNNIKITEYFKNALLDLFKKSALLIAVHNNTNLGYSVHLINESGKDAEKIFINPAKDADDFYYVTEELKFNYFKSNGYNVVLQNNTMVHDDGSLSVYCGKNKISYINIECEAGHFEEQIKMINEVYTGIKKNWSP